jgi:RimJ/RimL family protein N-acetyltransferase
MRGDGPNHPRVSVRPANLDDVDRVFQWRNDPIIAGLGESRRNVTWEEHAAWFAETMQTKRRLLLVIQVDDVPIGAVRFDDTDEDVSVVSIYLLDRYTGYGIGSTAFAQALEYLVARKPIQRIDARIVNSNQRSLRFFERLGFRPCRGETPEEGIRTLRLDIAPTRLAARRNT